MPIKEEKYIKETVGKNDTHNQHLSHLGPLLRTVLQLFEARPPQHFGPSCIFGENAGLMIIIIHITVLQEATRNAWGVDHA